MRKIAALAAALLLSTVGLAGAEQLDLKQCLSRASATNRGLKAASYQELLASEQIRIARSGSLPRIDLQAGFTAQQAAQGVAFGPTAFDTQDPDFPFVNLSATGTLYDFGRTKARIAQARSLRDAARHAFSGNQQDLFLEVVRAYFGILEAGKLAKAAEDEVTQMVSHQKTAQALFEQGVVTRNDLLQAEVRVASSRQKLLGTRNQVENGWLLLNYLISAPPQFRADLVEEVQLGPLPPPDTKPDLSRRGELVALRDTVAAADFAVKEAKTLYYPEIFGKLALDYLKNSKVTEQVIMSATVGFRVNLYDGLATTARLRQAVETRSRDEERLRDQEARVALEYSSAQNDLQVAKARIKVTEKAIQQGVENLRITRDRYQEKVGTATEVIDAQTLLTQTRADYFQSVFDYEVAAARVLRAMGEL